MSNLTRFGVAIDEPLLTQFDDYIAKQGAEQNRSEAVRRLIRETLIEENLKDPNADCVATLTVVFNHHNNDISEKFDAIQHNHFGNVIVATHVHLNHHDCLEVIVLRGKRHEIDSVAHSILGTKGVIDGKIAITSAGGDHE